MEADAWTVVGGSGRARTLHKVTSAQARPSKSAAGGMLLPVSAAQELPGWDEASMSSTDRAKHTGSHSMPTARKLKSGQIEDLSESRTAAETEQPVAVSTLAAPVLRNRRNASARTCKATTPDQQVARLVSQVEECRSEIRSSRFFKNLLHVSAAALAQHFTPTVCVSSESEGHSVAQLPGSVLSSPLPLHAADNDVANSTPAHLRVQQLIVYGLGSPEESRVSRYQLAIVLLLRDELLATLNTEDTASATLPSPATHQAGQPPDARAISSTPHISSEAQVLVPQLFDPAFSEIDVLLIHALGLAVLGTNEGGARSVQQPTMFYLPHCEAKLCEALISANWSAAQLPHLIILGNSFSTYDLRWSLKTAQKQHASSDTCPTRLLKSHTTGAVLELPTPDHSFQPAGAFNDMSLHIFPSSRLPSNLFADAVSENKSA